MKIKTLSKGLVIAISLGVVLFGVNKLKAVAKTTNNESISISSPVTENILSRIDQRVIREMDRAWRASGAGLGNYEVVLLLFRMDDGSLEARRQPKTNEQRKYSLNWDPSAVAIVHTHPNDVDPRPSWPDQKTADKLAVPIFTLTYRGMYVYDPQTQKVRQVHRWLDWLDPSNWKSSRQRRYANEAKGDQT
jgi:hypothetical protein